MKFLKLICIVFISFNAKAQGPYHYVKRFTTNGPLSEAIMAYDIFNSILYNDSILYTSELNGTSPGSFPNDRYFTFRKINSYSGFQYSQNSFSDSCNPLGLSAAASNAWLCFHVSRPGFDNWPIIVVTLGTSVPGAAFASLSVVLLSLPFLPIVV